MRGIGCREVVGVKKARLVKVIGWSKSLTLIQYLCVSRRAGSVKNLGYNLDLKIFALNLTACIAFQNPQTLKGRTTCKPLIPYLFTLKCYMWDNPKWSFFLFMAQI
jgi:hypothetical protein